VKPRVLRCRIELAQGRAQDAGTIAACDDAAASGVEAAVVVATTRRGAGYIAGAQRTLAVAEERLAGVAPDRELGSFARAFDAMPREHLLPWTCWEPQGTDKGKAKPRPSKLKYTCRSCAANAWGKPGLLLRCGQCDEPMVSEREENSGEDPGRSTRQAA